jgi:hypothetical protein
MVTPSACMREGTKTVYLGHPLPPPFGPPPCCFPPLGGPLRMVRKRVKRTEKGQRVHSAAKRLKSAFNQLAAIASNEARLEAALVHAKGKERKALRRGLQRLEIRRRNITAIKIPEAEARLCEARSMNGPQKIVVVSTDVVGGDVPSSFFLSSEAPPQGLCQQDDGCQPDQAAQQEPLVQLQHVQVIFLFSFPIFEHDCREHPHPRLTPPPHYVDVIARRTNTNRCFRASSRGWRSPRQ